MRPEVHAARPLQWLVSLEEDAIRLDAFLASRLGSFSRRERAALIEAGRVFLNGRPVAKGARVQTRDCISVFLPDAPAFPPLPPVIVEYSDASIIIVNKPSGLHSVALRRTDTQTVANFLLARFPETAQAGARPFEAGLVHRLDAETSGLLLAARTSAAYAALREQFRARSVEKQYLAIVKGILTGQGCVASPLEPTGPRGHRMRLSTANRGQEAFTRYWSVECLPHHTVVRLTISTGVRHQIRVHLATLGHPIVGDKIYGEADHRAARLYLHAETLTFSHPATGLQCHYTSALPEDFSAMLMQLRRRSTRSHALEKEGHRLTTSQG